MATKTADIQPGKSACRFCFTEGCSKNISTVYIWKERKEVYSEMLSETFNISIVCADSNLSSISHHICELCIGRLRDASEFKKQVIESEQTLQWQILQPTQSLSTLGLNVASVALNAGKVMDLNVKEETESLDDDDDMRTASKDSPHCNSDESKILEEELFSDSLDTIKRRSTCVSTKIKGYEDQKCNNKKTKRKESTEKLDRNTASRNMTKRKNFGNAADDAVRKNSIAILRHSTAYPFQPSKTSFRCCFCPYTPSHYDPNAFRQHMDSTHAQIDKSSCLKHYNESMRRVDITNLRCKDCSNQFQSLEDLAKHLVEFHNYDMDLSQSVGLVPIRLDTERFACVICSKTYSTLHQLSRHSGTHFYRNICYKCGGNFETLKGFKKHVLLKHSTHKFICQTCKLPFPDLSSKKEHLRNSKRCQSFKCKFCKERFLCMETQQAHSVKAHGEAKTTYPCPECGDVFEKRINRYKHFKIVHTEDFKCNHCGTKFSNNRSLQDHVARVHTFERKYKCPTCDKAFIDARTLRTHTFIHDESKRHACSVCTRSFTIKTRLKYHIQKYHPDILTDIFPMRSDAEKISS